jgi:hypothetical protein
MADAFAHRGAPSSTPPPRQGMSGCAIAVIVGGVVLVFGVFIAGILAAIAVPAYNDYLLRSKVAAAELHVSNLQSQIELHRLDADECPDNAALGLDDPADLRQRRPAARRQDRALRIRRQRMGLQRRHGAGQVPIAAMPHRRRLLRRYRQHSLSLTESIP